MLKLNTIVAEISYKPALYLNTTIVKVKRQSLSAYIVPWRHLNTTIVKVKHKLSIAEWFSKKDLNTTIVKVKH